MTDAPLVSVVLPTFNRAQVLARAIGSVLSQSYGELELIIVDDGSTDETESVVKACQDPRVRYLRQPNAGPGAARNAGVRHARGELIAFQDSDDEWLPEKLQKQVARLHQAPADIGVVVCGHREYRPEKVTELKVDEFMARGDAPGSLLTGLWYVPPTWLVRRSALERAGPYDERLPSCEDWDLAFRLSDVCGFACVPEVLVVKHHTRGSVFDFGPGRIAGFRQVLERHRQRWRVAQYWLARQEFVLGYWMLNERGRPVAGMSYLLRAAWHHPRSHGLRALREICWRLLPGRIRKRLWAHDRVRRAFGVFPGAAERTAHKPVARVFSPMPLDPQYPNGFSERWFHFLRALAERFEVEVVAVRGVWATHDIDPALMRPAIPLRRFELRDSTWGRHWPKPLNVPLHALAQLNTTRLGPKVVDGDGTLRPPPDLAIFLSHFLAHLAFRLPYETPCLFVLEEGLVRMEHVNLPEPGSLVRARRLWRAWKQRMSEWRYAKFIARCGRRGPAIAISEQERLWFNRWLPPGRTKTIGLGLDPADYPLLGGAPDHDVAVFGDLGQLRNYAPVLELIRRAAARADARNLRWLLVGRNPVNELKSLPREVATVTGEVPDTRPFYARARVVLVPARIVTGSKTTLLKAWALARPVVSSPESAAGIPARSGENLIIADGADRILDAVLGLLRDPATAAAIGAAGRITLENQCNQRLLAREFADFCELVAQSQGGVLDA